MYLSFLEKTVLFFIIMSILYNSLRIILIDRIWDKLLSLNMISSNILMIIVFFAAIKNTPMYLDVAFAYSLVGFLGLSLISSFILKGGRTK